MNYIRLAILASLVFTLSAQARINIKTPLGYAPILGMQVSYVTQPIDRQNPTSATYQQRIMFSDAYAKSKDAPVILYLCGEWTCDPSGTDYMASGIAKEMGAYVVGIEHRYYGESLPEPKVSINNLHNLHTEAAIEDAAAVQRKLMADNGLTGKWYTLGGSYGGTLAADYRIAHPELAAGALAYSAPMHVTPQGFDTYEGVARAAYGEELSQKVRTATTFILDKFDLGNEGKKWIQTNFGLPTLNFDALDVASMFVTVIPEISQAGQNAFLANSLSGNKTPEQLAQGLIAALKNFDAKFWSETPYGVAQDDPSNISDTSRWVYQTYTQYGWHYVSDPDLAKSFSPISVDINFYRTRLAPLFANEQFMEYASYQEKIFQTLKSDASKIMFFNSSFDPWMSLSWLDDSRADADILPFMTLKARHCQGMGPLVSSPNALEYQGQRFLLQKLKAWITQN